MPKKTGEVGHSHTSQVIRLIERAGRPLSYDELERHLGLASTEHGKRRVHQAASYLVRHGYLTKHEIPNPNYGAKKYDRAMISVFAITPKKFTPLLDGNGFPSKKAAASARAIEKAIALLTANGYSVSRTSSDE